MGIMTFVMKKFASGNKPAVNLGTLKGAVVDAGVVSGHVASQMVGNAQNAVTHPIDTTINAATNALRIADRAALKNVAGYDLFTGRAAPLLVPVPASAVAVNTLVHPMDTAAFLAKDQHNKNVGAVVGLADSAKRGMAAALHPLDTLHNASQRIQGSTSPVSPTPVSPTYVPVPMPTTATNSKAK